MSNLREDLLANRVLLVTGAGDGIGKEAAISFAKHGGKIILLGRTKEKLEKVYDQICETGAREHAIVNVDLTTLNEATSERLKETIKENYGQLDVLLHNAAVLGARVPLESYDSREWATVIQTNMTAVFLLTKTLLPLLKQSLDGRIIFTNSGVGKTPRAYWGAYSVSKFALSGFVKILSEELENTAKVVVTSVNPGPTRTSMRQSAYPGEDPRKIKNANSLMPLYLYLAGPDSKHEHGNEFSGDPQTWDWLNRFKEDN
ncbi:MAG: YciK family oxidoreductase [Pseudomonadota bacterium]|nr:YciK family oxidoreductase [Pseudomonadota bacterium]